jgi:hypothetical protein
MIFAFVVKYLNFLKHLYPLPLIFDGLLMLFTWAFRHEVYEALGNIEKTVASWPGIKITLHQYGGFQFNVNEHEIGHMHSNGLVDILFDLKTKQQLLKQYNLHDHYIFKNSGWVSYYIRKKEDEEEVINLLKFSFEKHYKKIISER